MFNVKNNYPYYIYNSDIRLCFNNNYLYKKNIDLNLLILENNNTIFFNTLK